MAYIKNIEPEKVVNLGGLVQYMDGQVVSRTLAQNSAVSVTLFAFAKGEEIGTHDSEGDAMVTVLEGTGEFTVGGVKHQVKAGEALVMPAKIPHAVYAVEAFKMLLTWYSRSKNLLTLREEQDRMTVVHRRVIVRKKQ